MPDNPGRKETTARVARSRAGAFVWEKGAPQIPRLPPDFLSGLVVSVDLVRLSLQKAAYVAVDECGVVGNPEFARDDKAEGSCIYSEQPDRMDRRKIAGPSTALPGSPGQVAPVP